MRPGVYAALCGGLGALQMGGAATVAGLTGAYLDGSFDLDGHTVSCALSMKSASACTAAYVSATASILLSLLLVAMQCATAEGRVGMGFCGPILSSVGFFWWIAFAASATSAASGAAHWDEPGSNLAQYRTGVLGVSWACAALFMVSFFVSAAAAAAATRARNKLSEVHASMLRASPSKRFTQPAASPPSSPAKSCKSVSSAYEPFAESPKKWVQPANPRAAHCPVTSDGHRTLLLVEGEPVPLSPNLSPMGSPLAGRSPMHSFKRSPGGSPVAGRSPLARSLTHGAGSGSVGSFSNVLLPPGMPGSQQLWGTQD
ncbi:hypothetical protein ABPG75_007424 [Micractinium tetrahymenae]